MSRKKYQSSSSSIRLHHEDRRPQRKRSTFRRFWRRVLDRFVEPLNKRGYSSESYKDLNK